MIESGEYTNELDELFNKYIQIPNGDIRAEMIEQLVKNLASTIAMTSGGDEKHFNALLEGAAAHLYREASDTLMFAKMIGAKT